MRRWWRRLRSWWAGPRWGRCLRCRVSWAVARGHATYWRMGRGMFPLCEECWAALTSAERLPYYRQLFDRWYEERLRNPLHPGEGGSPLDDEMWQAIEDAVLAGG